MKEQQDKTPELFEAANLADETFIASRRLAMYSCTMIDSANQNVAASMRLLKRISDTR